jgi:arylamine N-acetyltransferase
MYTPEQISQYLAHISFPSDIPTSNTLTYLTELQKYHLAAVPFENLTLHYSRCRQLSLDPQDLFEKVVDRRMGGYCMENNVFFATVLRSLGFTVFSTAGRVSFATAGIPGGAYMGW